MKYYFDKLPKYPNVKYENICNQILECFNDKYKYNNSDNEYYLDYNSQKNIRDNIFIVI